MTSLQNIVTRFAPSPTGLLHAGAYRTAVFSYLFARQNKGKFILRVEDTDKLRSKKEYEENIIDSLDWLGLEYDVMYKQSGRAGAHKAALEKLIAEDKAYVSKEKIEKEGDRAEVIRFRNPNRKVSWKDIIRGTVEFDTTELGDFIIAKSLDEPVFHFAVVVDDAYSGVTHIIRGEDHVSNTPRHLLLYEALGLPVPAYAHLPLVLAADRSKLSKRHGAKAVTDYRDMGFLPDALINYMALVGWNPGTEQEIFSKKELIKDFSLERVQKSGAIFSEEKLRWVNKEHIKMMSRAAQEKEVGKWTGKSGDIIKRITPNVIERIETFGDIKEMMKNGELDFYFEEPTFAPEKLLWKGEGDLSAAKKRLLAVAELLEKIPEKDFTAEKIKSAIWPYAEAEGRGSVLWPLRFALSGKDKSPDPFTLSVILGKKTAISRIEHAVKLCA